MDRREALKMLGAGGALVVASPVILPTFNVAHAASPADTGLAGLPEPGDPMPFTPASFPTSKFKQKQVSIVPDMSGITCDDGSAPIVTYEWRIVSVSWQKRKTAYLRVTEMSTNSNDPAGTQLIAMPPSNFGFSGPTGYSAASYASSFLIRKGSSKGDVKIDERDDYAVEVRVRWHRDGATSCVEAEYVFNGVGTATPFATNTNWTIAPV